MSWHSSFSRNTGPGFASGSSHQQASAAAPQSTKGGSTVPSGRGGLSTAQATVGYASTQNVAQMQNYATGWATSFGIYGNLSGGIGAGGGTAINFAKSDENGISWSLTGTVQGGAVAGGGAFIGGGVSLYDAGSVNQLNGTSYQMGRAGFNAGPATFSGEGVAGSGYKGATLYGGLGSFYTANSLTISSTSAIVQYNRGILSFGDTGSSSIFSIKLR
jgi:hypothetical protein